jgi:hypothetical protein
VGELGLSRERQRELRCGHADGPVVGDEDPDPLRLPVLASIDWIVNEDRKPEMNSCRQRR